MARLKLAIIGATGSALKRTIPALQNSEKVVVSSAYARDPDRLRDLCVRYDIKGCFQSVEEMLKLGDFDFIFIATPPFLHRQHIEYAVQTGKPIICEKPLTQNLEEARRAALLLKGYRAPFMVAHHLRHQQAMLDIKQTIAEGRIGRPTSCWCQWAFKLNRAASNASWKLDPELGGSGPFVDAGIHIIDLLIYLFGPPRYVVAQDTKVEFSSSSDNASALLCYPDLIAAINASQSTPAFGNHLLIYGTAGKIEARGAMGEKSLQKVILQTGDREETLDYAPTNLYAAEIEDFADLLLGKAQTHNGTSLQDALIGMELLDAIQRSSKVEKVAI